MASRSKSNLLHNLLPDSLIKAYHRYQADKHFYFEVQVAEHCSIDAATTVDWKRSEGKITEWI